MNMLNVIYYKVGEEPAIVEVENTLEATQQLVGGVKPKCIYREEREKTDA